mmetsp:Transcript_13568/g.34547  ORF Transcript_13568/g.34547 Transcript_13568/m.34547 type:complete len:272 (+) Transcript_13568:227-1042(+)
MASNVAFAKFPSVRVCPVDDVKTSSTPAICSSFFGTLAATIPVPRGAGTRRSRTEPHFPVSLPGTVCGFPMRFPQYPRRTGMTESFAAMIPPRIAVATSFADLTPSPTWPSPSPTTTKALKRVRWPARVCFWTGMILRTSSLRVGRKRSMISDSLTGMEKRKTSSMEVILPSRTRRPSLVMGTHTFSSSRPPRPRPRPRSLLPRSTRSRRPRPGTFSTSISATCETPCDRRCWPFPIARPSASRRRGSSRRGRWTPPRGCRWVWRLLGARW